jgi:hypothetical protein
MMGELCHHISRENKFRQSRHGGSAVAQYLRQELHGLFENVDKSHIPELFLWIKEIGGYFKRFRGGALTPWIHGTEGKPEMDLEARATQAFFEVGTYAVETYYVPCALFIKLVW